MNAKIKISYPHRERAKKYKLTEEQLIALFEGQGFKCATCDTPVSLDNGIKSHVDHCHETGVVRAVLCRSCNLAVGYARDDPELLERLATYLRSAKKRSTADGK